MGFLQILVLVRNFVPAHEQIAGGGWDIGAVCKKAYDLENKCIGIVGAGRIGRLVMERLKVSLPAVIHFSTTCLSLPASIMSWDEGSGQPVGPVQLSYMLQAVFPLS